MKELSLLNSDKVAIIDDDDFERVNNLDTKWSVHFTNKIPTRVQSTRKVFFGKNIGLHRFIMKHIKWTDFVIDHINRDIFDNRKCNLREASYRQNAINKQSTDRYKGVRWHIYYRKWEVSFTELGKRIRVGFYDDIKDAAQAYNNEMIRRNGNLVSLNIV